MLSHSAPNIMAVLNPCRSMTRLIASFFRRSRSGGVRAICCAIFRVLASRSAAGTVWLAQPQKCASAPLISLPAMKLISLAFFGPTSQAHTGPIRPPPIGSAGQRMLASSATSVMSQQMASMVAPAMQ